MNAGYLSVSVFAVTPAVGGDFCSTLLAIPVVIGLLIALALVVKLICYVIEYFDGVDAFIGAVGRSIWRHRVRVALVVVLAFVGGGFGAAVWAAQPARHRDYWCVPDREPIPEPLQETGQLAAAIKRDDAAWQAELDKITALIDAQRPNEFNLYKEIVTTDAMRRYVEKLLWLGESAVASMGRMKKTARELDVLLKEAPARYREMAAMQRRYEGEEPYADIKQNYRATADVFEAKAKAAELHHEDVRKSLNGHLEDHLKRQNVFLERFLTMLKQGLGVDELRGAAEFTKTLEDVTKGHEYLRNVLRTWRERMASEPVPVPGPGAASK